MSEHKHDSSTSEELVEPDVSAKMSILIWTGLFVFAVLLFLAMGALTIYFRYELEKERYQKVGMQTTSERKVLNEYEHEILHGPERDIDGKSLIPIDQAMEKFVALHKK